MRKASPNTSPGAFIHGTPYTPNMRLCAGVYKIVIGKFFYIGSTTGLGARVSEHRTRLEQGTHANHRLQEAYNANPVFTAVLVMEIPRKCDDTDDDHAERLRFREEWFLKQYFGKKRCLNLSASPYHNTTIGEFMKGRWADPAFRAAQAERMRELGRRKPGEATKLKMAKAKEGARNHKSRPCTLHFKGDTFKFESAGMAAKRFGVSQQTMHGWLTGAWSFPRKGPISTTSPKTRRWAGLTGSYD